MRVSKLELGIQQDAAHADERSSSTSEARRRRRGDAERAINIGAAALQSDVPAKTIRYYESVGLIPSARRTTAGYRSYDARDVQTLRFIQKARSLGFPVEDVRQLLALWGEGLAKPEGKELASPYIEAAERKIASLRAMRRALAKLARESGDEKHTDHPVLDHAADQD